MWFSLQFFVTYTFLGEKLNDNDIFSDINELQDLPLEKRDPTNNEKIRLWVGASKILNEKYEIQYENIMLDIKSCKKENIAKIGK